MTNLAPFLCSFLIGLLIGIEREKAHPKSLTMGVRTFLLLALLGAMAGWIQESWIEAAITLFALLLIVLSYIRDTQRQKATPDFGLTTEIAAAIVFCLGFGSHRDIVLVSILGPAVALVLFSKKRIHSFSKNLRPEELEAGILLLLLSMAVINLLDDRVIDPWNVFNPRKFGFIVLTLAAIDFVSYLAMKFLGETKGAWLIGFLGGLLSSTSVILSCARQANLHPTTWRRQLVSAVLASLASLAELLFIVAIVAQPLAIKIAPAVLLACILGAGSVYFLRGGSGRQEGKLDLPAPLDLLGVLRMATLLFGILSLIRLAQGLVGDNATQALMFLTAIFELHGVAIATATLYSQNILSLDLASHGIAWALAASFISKVTIGWMLEKGSFAKALSLILLGMGIAIVSVTIALP